MSIAAFHTPWITSGCDSYEKDDYMAKEIMVRKYNDLVSEQPEIVTEIVELIRKANLQPERYRYQPINTLQYSTQVL